MRLRSRSPLLVSACAAVTALAWSSSAPAMAATAPASETRARSGDAPDAAGAVDYSQAAREKRLAEKGMALGSPVMIRVFKQESELEVWMQKGDRFEHFATYPICIWSGKLGPKLREGDRQAPEGFYSVDLRRLHPRGRRPRSFDIGFPNPFDRSYGRTGSYIFVHGGCTSVGCFAMTDPIMGEIYALTERALQEGQQRIEVHAFPFRMTDANLAPHADSHWYDFWLNLKEGYDLFERTQIPPRVSVCSRRYLISTGDLTPATASPAGVGSAAALGMCEEPTGGGDEFEAVVAAEDSRPAAAPAYKAAARHVRRAYRGRSVRKNYAAARRARVAAYAKRMRTARRAEE